jgi:PAS domain S-box-containing protein
MADDLAIASAPAASPERSAVARYGVAMLAIAAAMLLRWALQPLLGVSAPFILFYPAVMVAGWYGGLGPGLLASGLAALLARYFFIPPLFSWALESETQVIVLGLFAVTAVFITLLNEAVHRARRREAAAESEAQESEGRFRIMADSAPVLIWMAGPDKLCDWFNRPWLEFTGRTMDQEIGEGWANGIHPEDRQRCLETYHTAFDARRRFSIEYRLRRYDGEYRWVLDNGIPRFGPHGELEGFIGSGVDIHERKVSEEAQSQLLVTAERALREAEAASRSKDEFLATVSHELRTPLNAIMGWAQLLQVDHGNPERLARGFETIGRNAKLQAQLIDDLLDVSRIVSGQMRLDVRPLDLTHVVEAAVESIRPAAEAKQIRLARRLDPQAGPVVGDPQRLQQVVWNLLSNAVKFTPRGGQVEVCLERVSSSIEIVVADTGPGISPEFLPYVFDRFRQLDSSSTRKQGGLGLGLAIVRHLTELHGGEVLVKSPDDGQGSTFVVRLPLSVVHLEDSDWKRSHPREGAGAAGQEETPDLRGIRVLVVDDEADARETLRQILSHCGAEVRTAASALEALEALGGYRPDVLLSDIGMPEQDGYALIRQVRMLPPEQGGRTPAAALTAFARGEDRRRALLAGFQTHLAKPIEIRELAAVVADLARGAAAGTVNGAGRPSPPG